jgi:hypothetical protein
VQAIAEVPLAEELTTQAHDFDALFRDAGSGVFRTMYAYTGGRRDIAEEAMAEAFAGVTVAVFGWTSFEGCSWMVSVCTTSGIDPGDPP